MLQRVPRACRLPRWLSTGLLATLAATPCLALGTSDASRPATPPAGELLHTPGLQLRWLPLAPSRTELGPAQVDAALESPLGRWRSTLRVDPAAPHPQRIDTVLDAGATATWPALSLGDTRSAASGWSTPVRFGGLRLGSASQPGWQLEAGRLRSDDAQGEPAYGSSYAAAAWQTRPDAALRLKARAEAAGERTLGGLELQAPLDRSTTVRSAFAHADDGSARWLLGAQRAERAGARWSLQAEHSAGGWTPLQGEATSPEALQAAAQWPVSPDTRLELGLRTARRADRLRDTSARLAARTRLAGRSAVRWELARSEGPNPGWQARLAVQVPLER